MSLDLILPTGGAQLSPVMPVHIATFDGAGALTANAAYLHKFRVSKSVPIASIKVTCAANASGFNGDAGIFTNDGTNFVLQRSSAPTAVGAATTGVLSFALSSSFVLVPDTDYWMAFVSDSATPTFHRRQPAATAMADQDVALAKTALATLATFAASGKATANNVLQIWAV